MLDPKKITAHFMLHWGPPSEIRPRRMPGIEKFAILEFGPTVSRKTWFYATNGMSSYAQTRAGEGAPLRTEVYCASKERLTWVDNLLAGIATYPNDHKTCLAVTDTIEVGQPIDQRSSPFTGVLFGPPPLATLCVIDPPPAEVQIHQVIGLLPGETAFAAQHGGRALWHLLGKQENFFLDEVRAPII